MIQAENIEKYYGSMPVLKGLSLEIKPSEIVAIVGKSGAGKSTLLHILGSLSRPSKGSVRINQTAIDALNDRQLADFRNQHIGFIFQFHHLLPEFTAWENVCMPALIKGKSLKSQRPRAEELLRYLGLEHRLEHKPQTLSGGEQQRVAVARALMNQPSVVFADEPSGNLDTQTSEELHRLFFDLRRDFGQTFVIVTHNLELAAMSDRRIELQDGRIVD